MKYPHLSLHHTTLLFSERIGIEAKIFRIDVQRHPALRPSRQVSDPASGVTDPFWDRPKQLLWGNCITGAHGSRTAWSDLSRATRMHAARSRAGLTRWAREVPREPRNDWSRFLKPLLLLFVCPGGGIPGLGANVGRVLGGTAPKQKHTGCRGTSVAGKAQQAEFLRRR